MTKHFNPPKEKQQYSTHDVIKMYEEILVGSRKKFPWKFWGVDKKRHAKILVKYLIEEKLGLTNIQEFPLHLNIKTLTVHGLGSILFLASYRSVWLLMNDVYPGQFKPWDFKKVPQGYWKGEQGKVHACEATRWLVEEKLKIPVSEIPKVVTERAFVKHKLGALFTAYGYSLYEVIENAYPGQFQPQDFARGKRKKK